MMPRTLLAPPGGGPLPLLLLLLLPLLLLASGPRLAAASQADMWLYPAVPVQEVQRYRLTVVPVTDPPTTYYAAMGGSGWYAGIQNCGGTCGKVPAKRQLIFSTWNAGDANAVVVQQGDMTYCGDFGGEGTGKQCFAPFNWRVGRRYRFEANFTRSGTGGYVDTTIAFTDVAAKRTLQLGTHRYMSLVEDYGAFYAFAENWGWVPNQPCSETTPRHLVVGGVQAMYNGRWRPVTQASFSRFDDPTCLNWVYQKYCKRTRTPTGSRVGLSGWLFGQDGPFSTTNSSSSGGRVQGCVGR